MPPIAWQPQPGSQTLFLTCPLREVCYSGTRGPGKTDALLMDFARGVGQGHGGAWRGMLLRQSFPQLRDAIAKTERWFRQIFPEASFNANKYEWRWPGGETLTMAYIRRPRDYWNYHGWEIPWLGWEELTNWPTRECYDLMKSCNRSQPGVPVRIRATCNPWGPGHTWVKNYWVDPAPAGHIIEDEHGRRLRISGHWSENEFLTLDYVRGLQRDSNPNRRRAWLKDDWDIVAGAFFGDIWQERYHVITPFEIPASWRVYRAFDWGSSAPFSVGWWALVGDAWELADGRQLRPGDWIRIAEWYGWTGEPNQGSRLSSQAIAAGILERERVWERVLPGPADTQIFQVTDGESIADKMATAGVRWEPAAKGAGSRAAGCQIVRDYLEGAVPPEEGGQRLPRESPGLFVFDTCRQFLRTVPTVPTSERDPETYDTDSEDHVADETRYMLMFATTKGGGSSSLPWWNKKREHDEERRRRMVPSYS